MEQKISDKVYNINAWISGRFISRLHKPKLEDMEHINTALADIIKELREHDM